MKNNLSRILGERLLRVSDLQTATGISRVTLTKLYRRESGNVNLETLTKICDYLQIPLSELIEYVPEQKEEK